MILPISLLIVGTTIFGHSYSASISPLSSTYPKNVGHPRHRFPSRIAEDNKILTKPANNYPEISISGDNKMVDDLIDDFEEQEIGSMVFDDPSKRQDDDYGHLRFGKRDDNDAFDYGRFRYLKRSPGKFDRILRNGKANNDGNNEDYGHLRFGR